MILDRKLILHIPHSSTRIPYKDGYVVDDGVLENEILKLTDWYTDDLFAPDQDIPVRANFSRIFCDPERFTDDQIEKMAKKGMGVLYETTDDGRVMRVVDPVLKKRVLEEFYWPHHRSLSKEVSKQLQEFGNCLIIDCHSFPDIPLKRELNQDPDRPDINIGTDPFHTPESLVKKSVAFFESQGYSVYIDCPFDGSLVPKEYYRKNSKVYSVLVEINRRLYLNEPTNERSEYYQQIRSHISEYLKAMREWIGRQ